MSPLLPGLLDSLRMPQLSLQLHALRLPAPVASAFQLGDGSVRWGRLAAAALAALALGSQLWWLRLRAQYGLPAPLWRPLFGAGALLEMVLDPVGFWDARAAQARSDRRGMCLDYLLGHPLVFVTDTALSQKVFSDTAHFKIFTHPNAKWLMATSNFIYFESDKHKAVRRLMIPGLYEKASLYAYVPVVESIFRAHMKDIAASGQHIDCMLRLRVTAARASQESFVGPYLSDDERTTLAENMLVYTMGFLSLPLPFIPGTGLNKAITALHSMHRLLLRVFRDSMAYVLTGGEPRCVVDHWARDIQTKADPAFCADFTELNWTETLTDALFAAQDATVSALCWAVDVLQRHPAAFQACRDEIDALLAELPADGKSPEKRPLSQVFTKLRVISDTAHEVLRYRPPVPMLPHIARKDIDIDGVHVPAGTMVVASIDKAVDHGTFSPGTNADKNFDKTHTFGAGPHKCPGRFYAITTLTLFIALLAADYDVEPLRPDARDAQVYFPTLFPEQASFKFVPRQKMATV